LILPSHCLLLSSVLLYLMGYARRISVYLVLQTALWQYSNSVKQGQPAHILFKITTQHIIFPY
jgi:hypothetical protein